MTINPKELLEGFRHLSTNPKLTIGLATLALPMYFIHVATRLIDHPGGQFIVVGAGIVSLSFAGWLVCQFNMSSSDVGLQKTQSGN